MASPSCSEGNSGHFAHEKGDLVLIKWNDGMVYFAKIKRVDFNRKKCTVIFDDRSTDEADFSQIHSVDETTTDIICIKCKKDDSESPNEIVLCDQCGIGFHQKCHSPPIPASALELNSPWHCVYCIRHVKNPYLTESIDVMQSLFEEEDETNANRVVKVKVEKDEEMETAGHCMEETLPPPPPQEPAVPKKRKVGRPRLSEAAKRNRMRPLEVLRRKLAKTTPGSHVTSATRNLRKRQSGTSDESSLNTSPKARRMTIERHTVSVQQMNSGIVDSISTPNSSAVDDESDAPECSVPAAKKPRSLRVSLTLPPSVETSPVSSTTQKSPPEVQLPWKQQTPEADKILDSPAGSGNIADGESSPEPSLRIKVEENDENEQRQSCLVQCEHDSNPNATTHSSNDSVSTPNNSVAQTVPSSVGNKTAPPPLSSGETPLSISSTSQLETFPTSSQVKVKSSVSAINESEDLLIVSTPTQNQSLPPPVAAAAVPASNNAPLVQSSSSDDKDVIIIEDNVSSNAPHASPKEIPQHASVITPSPTIAAEKSLVKVAAGVTTLKPSKYKRASVIQSSVSPPPPLATSPSPLEQLQMQVKQANLLNKSRRNSTQGINSVIPAGTPPVSSACQRSLASPQTYSSLLPPHGSSKKITTVINSSVPLSHEPCNEHHRNFQQQVSPTDIHSPHASTMIQRPTHLQTETVPPASVQANNSAVSAMTTKAALDERAFSREIISATRSRKPLATPVHYPPELKSQQAQKRLVPANATISKSSTTAINNSGYTQSAATSYIASPVNYAPHSSTICATPAAHQTQAVVVTPTTITATGEVATIYTLLPTEQALNDGHITYSVPAQKMGAPSHVNAEVIQPVVLAQQMTPTQMGSTPAVVAVATDTPSPAVPAVMSYYTIMEVPPAASHHSEGVRSQAAVAVPQPPPTVNTTKPYAVVNAIPTNPVPPPGSHQHSHSLRSSPNSLKMAPVQKKVATNNPTSYNSSPLSPQKQLQVKEKTAHKMREEDIVQQQLLCNIRSKHRRDFDNFSEDSLLNIFHTALRQFQENGKKYELHMRPVLVPPNVEVLDNSGVPVQQISRGSRVIKPKPHRLTSNQNIVMTPTEPHHHQQQTSASVTSPRNRISGINYIQKPAASYPASNSVIESAQRPQQKLVYQVQTAGVFVPPELEQHQKQPQHQQPVYRKHQQQQDNEQGQYYRQQKRLLHPSKQQQQSHYSQPAQHVLQSQHGPAAGLPQDSLSSQQQILQQQSQTTATHSLAHSKQFTHQQSPQYTVIVPAAQQTNTRQIVRNGRTYLVADSPTAAVSAATAAAGSVVMRRTTSHSTAPNSSSYVPDAISTGTGQPVHVGRETLTQSLPPPYNSSHIIVPNTTTTTSEGALTVSGVRNKRDRVCTLCKKDATFLCSGCHSEWYCGKECQLKAWDLHADYCKSY